MHERAATAWAHRAARSGRSALAERVSSARRRCSASWAARWAFQTSIAATGNCGCHELSSEARRARC
ncbi:MULTISPECIES: hypothetical protein [unclassified Streptosporangium]|uniref:hypothetical protein n=1 Tax=unclassified Streptosporangium TaxID=2632669 RepID=UPI002E29EB45|nr:MULTISPECIES: hypothetical protein [unclassified Streptosporangium]